MEPALGNTQESILPETGRNFVVWRADLFRQKGLIDKGEGTYWAQDLLGVEWRPFVIVVALNWWVSSYNSPFDAANRILSFPTKLVSPHLIYDNKRQRYGATIHAGLVQGGGAIPDWKRPAVNEANKQKNKGNGRNKEGMLRWRQNKFTAQFVPAILFFDFSGTNR